jgi:hypothetical protein
MALKHRTELGPPKDLIASAKAVMGAIDFDPFSTKEINGLVQAAKFYDRGEGSSAEFALEDIIARPWDLPGEKRALVGPAHGAQWTRRLINKTFREYRKGNVDQAVIWIANSETLTKVPWIWNYPVCIPFKRLQPTWYDDELEMYKKICPSSWSCVIYLPPADANRFHSKLSLFHASFFTMGPIIMNEMSGHTDWEKAYELGMKKKYNFYT